MKERIQPAQERKTPLKRPISPRQPVERRIWENPSVWELDDWPDEEDEIFGDFFPEEVKRR